MSILTNFERSDFENILMHYNIGKYRSHKHVSWALGNTIYFFNTSKGKYVLKIFENSDPNFINYQLKLVNTAEKNGLPIPKTILTKSKESLLISDNKRIMVQEFIDGKHPEKLSTELIINVAKNQAKLNRELLKIKLENRYNWNGDYHFGLMSFNVKRFENFNIRVEENKILKELQILDKSKLRRSSVHGDFHSVNLLVKNDKLIAILDWDDAHEDYLIHDVVCFIAHSFIKPKTIYKKQITLYLKEYQKYLKLNEEEKKAIYYFMKQRYLASISWQVKQMKNHTDIHEKIVSNIRNDIKQYKHFSNTTLTEFLKLF